LDSELCPPLALYIHIPWCERKCPYCDFNSHEGFDPQVEATYVDALIADLDSQLPWAQDRPLQSIFIGGGTPSLFSAASIGRVLEAVDHRLTLAPDVEITLESNPGSAEADRYAGYRSGGVNRVSIGVQSFDDRCLERLGRIHNAATALRAIELARRAGFARYNIDLMHGLPGQTPAQAVADLEQAVAHHGGHVSWYQLTIEPNTVFWRQPPQLPVEDALADIQQAGEAVLAEAGLRQYEVSAFALPGQESRHNSNYWCFGDYLAIGAGAHGKVSLDGQVYRFQRSRVPRDYMAPLQTPGTPFEPPALTALDSGLLAGEFMLNALRLREGVPATLFGAHTGLDVSALEPALTQCREYGLLREDKDRLGTTALGFRFLNDVVGRFLPD
jgi:oxygen-independent coproporphyrinogen-3 oxidase